MPTVLRRGPYRFSFYSHESKEPPHIHVHRDEKNVKYWLRPIGLANSSGFSPVELRMIERLVWRHHRELQEAWVTSFGESAGERIKKVRCTRASLIVDLVDGRTLSVPIVWYPRLLNATPPQRANWRLIAGGFGIHWPDVDEDLSIEGLLRGAPAPRSSGPQAGRSPSSREVSAPRSPLRKAARPAKRKSVRRTAR